MSLAVTRDALRKENYVTVQELQAAMPMRVWAVDLEVERGRSVSAAELAILNLLSCGVEDVPRLTKALGLGEDPRLVERVLVKLLMAGAVDARGEGFVPTDVGESWRSKGVTVARERVTTEIRLDPVRDRFEWVDYERGTFATKDTWTIELPDVDDEVLLARKAEIGNLVRQEGLPDDEDRAPIEKLGRGDLRAVAVVSRRVHWRGVRLEVMEHPQGRQNQLIGYLNDTEYPPLTRLLAGHAMVPERCRLVPR